MVLACADTLGPHWLRINLLGYPPVFTGRIAALGFGISSVTCWSCADGDRPQASAR